MRFVTLAFSMKAGTGVCGLFWGRDLVSIAGGNC